MATIFLDSSSLVRRYDRAEPGAGRVRAACAPLRGNGLMVARMTLVEVASAFSRKAREGTFTPRQLTRHWRLFRSHLQDQYQVVDVTEDAYTRAEQLVFAHVLRAYDAVQIACALDVASRLPQIGFEFWTADRRQAQVAAAEGLAVRLVG